MAKLPAPQIKPIFPSRETLEQAEAELKGRLPIVTPNELMAALALYHNTILRVIEKEA